MSTDLEGHILLLMYTAVLVAALTVNLLNLFIVAVNFLDYLKGRQLKTCDKIQGSLAVSRMGYQCVYLYYDMTLLFQSGGIRRNQKFSPFINSMFFYTSLWIAALLSVLYFLKIANYKNVFFLLLKRLITQKVHYFIITAFLIALCFSYLQIRDMFVGDVFSNFTYVNDTMDNECETDCININALVFSMGNLGPFIMYSSFFFSLLTSMCRHMKQMRSRDTGFASKHLDAYYAAIKSIAACFLLFTLQFVTSIVHMILISTMYKRWIGMLLVIFPSLHSGYLVYGTPKLRQQFYLLCLRIRNCCKKPFY
uniref:Taste receptor type 2 n=1 Tax=Leptobrachium leishanense TaxID=445787 RepID=A0A8C5MJK7_9ANUR